MEKKKKYSKTVVEFEGYGADPVPEEGQSLDWSDRFFLTVHPQDLQKLKFWPESPAYFRVLSNSERDRISIAMFYTPEKGKQIGPEDGLVDGERPKLFKKVRDYADIHWEYYQRGMRAHHIAEA